ncbi:MAG TPA: hypothetical protein VKU85_14130, partial [bacterium]|nr:hypothetical protein [bacterium]
MPQSYERSRWSGRPTRGLAALALVVCLSPTSPVAAQTLIDARSWGANGTVFTVVETPDVIYVGGSFTMIRPVTGQGAQLDLATGQADLNFPRLNVGGQITAVAPDGAGGWYIGGDFSLVGAESRISLAHIQSDGTVSDWAPEVKLGSGTFEFNGDVYAISVTGSTVYIGGNFSHVDGQLRSCLAAIDRVTGDVAAWGPGTAGKAVRALVVDGSTAYVGGEFTSIGGETRNYIAAVDAGTGAILPWDPSASSFVRCLAVEPGAIYVGGNFTSIGGQSRSRIAELDPASGTATSWDPAADNTVFTLDVDGASVYAGGSFLTIGGASRTRLAELDAATGLATGWNPVLNGGVYDLAVGASEVYVGGSFSSPRRQIVAFGRSDGMPTSWDPSANADVFALALTDDALFAGGQFTSIGGVRRNHIAALDAR